jgi:hypothetical protein
MPKSLVQLKQGVFDRPLCFVIRESDSLFDILAAMSKIHIAMPNWTMFRTAVTDNQ